MKSNYKTLKLACYTGNITMSATANLSPLLFLTFKSRYGISFSLLGLLVLINFVTQLAVDLVFSFFSHKFNIQKTVRMMPVIAFVGFGIYSLIPTFFPDKVYLCLVLGTIIFSAASGLAEVLLSPIIAAIPSDDPDKEMSKLHSSYAWGVVFTIAFASAFLLLFGSDNWQLLALLLSLIPLLSAILFGISSIPKMETPERMENALAFLKNKGVWLCVFAIFLGGSSECTMAQWASTYLEAALSIPKTVGDILGVAMFALMLGLGRTLYSKYGSNIEKINLIGSIGAFACYLAAAFSNVGAIGLVGCALTGLCTSMMWPGSLIVASDRFPKGGVFIYAMMAAGGDLGASVGPQMVGLVTDAVIASADGTAFAAQMGLAVEQLGMQLGLLIGMLFPLMAIPVYAKLRKDG